MNNIQEQISKLCNPNSRIDVKLIFDVQLGNPNGDPDNNGAPRIETSTGRGLVSDVCIKRKIRDYVNLRKQGEEGYDIYVMNDSIPLERKHEEIVGTDIAKDKKKATVTSEELMKRATTRFWDVRMFGGAMVVRPSIGSIRGPLQLSLFASVDPVDSQEITITRCAPGKVSDNPEEQKGQEMGRKYMVPYALFEGQITYNAPLGMKQGVTSEDLAVFWEALLSMFEFDRAAGRGLMTVRKIVAFVHDSPLGTPYARAADLMDGVKAERVTDTDFPQSWEDYKINVNVDVPNGVTVVEIY